MVKNYNMTVTEIDKAEFQAATQCVYDQFRDEIGADLMDKIFEILGR